MTHFNKSLICVDIFIYVIQFNKRIFKIIIRSCIL